MEVHTFEEIHNNIILGLAWGNCITNYYTTFASDLDDGDYKTLLEYSMFGDPSLGIEDGKDPINIPFERPLSLVELILDNFPRLATILEHILARLS